jgi:hypothetical protein
MISDKQAREMAEEVGNVERNADWRDASFKASLILLLHEIAKALDMLARK